MERSLFLCSFSLILLSGCLLGSQAPAPVAHYGKKQGAGSGGVHTVTPGENLWSISKRYNIVMRDIVISNSLSAPFILNAGQRLRLPPPREYRVRAGDTLYEVSRVFATDMSQIARLNDLSAPYRIQPGQVLRLPSESAQREEYVAQALPGQKPEFDRGVSGAGVTPAQKPRFQKASAATRAKITAKTPKRSSSKFLKPVRGKVVSAYGPKKGGLHNDGMNIAAARGTPVSAAENGVVMYAGSELRGSGNLVLVRHENRWMTAYAHLDKIKVKRGQVLKRGETLGTVGSTGSVTSPQLHFEVRRGTEAINPARSVEGS